jgi:hypothetical protein
MISKAGGRNRLKAASSQLQTEEKLAVDELCLILARILRRINSHLRLSIAGKN